jgi:serine/threonine-protein kinase
MTKPKPQRPTPDARVGKVVAERYRIDALVDRGAMGQVYVGEHVLMRKRVAIKVLHPELSAVPAFIARFEREAMAAANIDNEHVVAATDFGTFSDGAVFLVLEYVEGKNLRDEMSPGPMPLVRALHIARQIAYALRSAHALGIVHRDLKPENVMLVEKSGDPDFVKVLDFGIAKVPIGEKSDDMPSDRPITRAGMVFGTPEYMPPEQALGQDVDERADLYALGVMVYEMLAGCRPFAATSQVGVLGQQLQQPVPRIVERAPGVTVPSVVERFVFKLLERDAENRYPTADSVLDAIDRHLGYSPGRLRVPTLNDGSFASSVPPSTLRDPEMFDDFMRKSKGKSDPDAETNPPDALAQLSTWLDARRHRLPRVLRGLPGPVLFSMPFAVCGMVVGFSVFGAMTRPDKEKSADRVLATSSAAPQAPNATPAPSNPASATSNAAPSNPPKTRATDQELATATASGDAALDSLAAKYPGDALVELAIANASFKRKDVAKALTAIRSALALAPNLEGDSQIASILWIASQNKATSDDAFALLEGPMGDRGASILHDLVTTAGVRPAVKDKANKALRAERASR